MKAAAAEPILTVESLSKRFDLHTETASEFWALKNVTFDVYPGEILGIVGKNGAGKSTLLKVLSRITPPTDGRIEYEGRLSSIIEIGTGFHPELTGRENVFVGGSIMGLSRKKIREVYDQIVDFAELRDFMETPVKYYSNGMYLRLAFSLAFLLPVDILILDEVLAVGDVDFRRKCYDHIRQMRDEGVAIVLVSHHMEPIVSFCDRCIWLDKGEIREVGAPMQVVESYLGNADIMNRSGSHLYYNSDLAQINLPYLKICSFEIFQAGSSNQQFETDQPVNFRLTCEKTTGSDSFEIAFYLHNMNDVRVLMDSYGFRREYTPDPVPEGVYVVEWTVPANWLNRGVYWVGIIFSRNLELVKEIENVASFVMHSGNPMTENLSSVFLPRLDWEIRFREG